MGQLRSVLALDTLLRRDRAIVGGALVATALVAWLYLFHLSRAMPGMNMADMPGMAMSRDHAWGVVDVALLFVMWAAMMIAMMVPAAAPMVLTFAMVQRKQREQDRASIPTVVFLLGLRGRMDRVCRGGGTRAVATPRGGPPLHRNGERERMAGWGVAPRCGCLPVDLAQASVPRQVSLTALLSDDRMA